MNNAERREPRTDEYATPEYYFEKLNNGHSYFISGHSQGSRLCYIILAEYVKKHPYYYENMITTYCIGDSLTKSYLEENPMSKRHNRLMI